MDNLVLSPVPLPELMKQLRQVVKEEILASQQTQLEEKFLSPAEVCKMFVPAITRPTLDKICSEGKLTKRHMGTRIYFKYSDVIQAVKSYKRYEQSVA